MDSNDTSAESLKHELANVSQQKLALQHLLGKATDKIEELVESDCDPEIKHQASLAAERFRQATEF
ncbi:MAG: hypothetical protein ABIT09_06335 [Croceibacterium sp.]